MGELLPAKSVVRVVPYDPSWPTLFQELAAGVRVALGAVAIRVEHIGSTAVPGLAAKPAVDLSLIVTPLDPEAPYREPLESLGYEYGGQFEEFFAERRYFKLNRNGARVANLHATLAGSATERRHLAFRDALRRDPETAAAYERLKFELAARFPADRVAYTEEKADFIEAVLTRVLRQS